MATKMQTAHGPDREMFRSFSEMKDYDAYLIGKLSCIHLEQNSFENEDGQGVCETVERGMIQGEVGKYRDGQKGAGTVLIRKQKNNFVVLELQGEQYLLTIALFRPESFAPDAESNKRMAQKAEKAKEVPGEMIARRSFAVTEILEFVENVGDTNGIHRTADPVVPGLLMAEWFFAVLQSADWDRVEMRFHVPAYAGQTLYIEKKSEKYTCYEENTRQVLWTAVVEGVCINQ